jgi:predicted TIM-barrel fold metal-dependent hydrolase
MEIVDAQVHQPHPPKAAPTHSAESKLLLGIELAREAMDSVGVDAALLNAPPDFVDAAIERYPERFAACLSWDANTISPDEWISAYRMKQARVAVRVSIASPREDKLLDEFMEGRLEPLFTAAEMQGLPVFFSTHGHTHALGAVARSHPELAVIVDHLGLSQPPVVRARRDPWDRLPSVLGLAVYPNVVVKFSGAPSLSRQPYPHRDLWPQLHKIIEHFGPDRLMWGSDFTRMRMSEGHSTARVPKSAWAGLYSDAVSYLRDTNEISSDEKERILGGTIRRVLKWPRPVDPDYVFALDDRA